MQLDNTLFDDEDIEATELDEQEEDQQVKATEEVQEQPKEKVKPDYHVGHKEFDEYCDFVASKVKAHLDEFSGFDEHFNECYQNPNKDFNECMIYVINQVWLDKTQSPDDICYQNARHYYLEDIPAKELKKQYHVGGGAPTGKSSKTMDEDEIKKIKAEAIAEYKAAEKAKEETKKAAKAVKHKPPKQEEAVEQPNLFSFM